jgi:hypothetical protein
LKTGVLPSTRDLFYKFGNEKHKKQRWYVQLLLLTAILARWWRLVASSEALDLLYWEMGAVLYRCTATAIKMASKVGAFFIIVLFAVIPAVAGAIRRE